MTREQRRQRNKEFTEQLVQKTMDKYNISRAKACLMLLGHLNYGFPNISFKEEF